MLSKQNIDEFVEARWNHGEQNERSFLSNIILLCVAF